MKPLTKADALADDLARERDENVRVDERKKLGVAMLTAFNWPADAALDALRQARVARRGQPG